MQEATNNWQGGKAPGTLELGAQLPSCYSPEGQDSQHQEQDNQENHRCLSVAWRIGLLSRKNEAKGKSLSVLAYMWTFIRGPSDITLP